ncbi:hypothetical protein PENTCL1PPCAC_23774, partial [Pristionchus entomophagus]
LHHPTAIGVGWKEMRSVISAIFTVGKMKKMHLLFHEHLDNLIDVLREKSQVNDGKIEIYRRTHEDMNTNRSQWILSQNV